MLPCYCRVKDALAFLGVLQEFGIRDATLRLSGSSTSMEIAASGKPMLVTEEAAKGSPLLTFINKFLSSIRVGVSAKTIVGGSLVFEAKAGTSPIKISDTVSLADSRDEFGPAVFARRTKAGVSDTKKVGLQIPLKICVKNCAEPDDASKQFILFTGEISVSVGGASLVVSGDLKMDGWWNNVLGFELLHVGNAMMGIGYDVYSNAVTRLMLGGQMHRT